MKSLHLNVMMALLGLSVSSAALAIPAKPAGCPSIASIKQAGLTESERDDEDGSYIAGTVNTYGTRDTWGFVVMMNLNQASSPEDALNKARAALPTISGNPQPYYTDNHWACMYNIGNGYFAGAVTPITFSKAMAHSAPFK